MKRWLWSYWWWSRFWARKDGRPFERCYDCGKHMCLSAHLDCIPF